MKKNKMLLLFLIPLLLCFLVIIIVVISLLTRKSYFDLQDGLMINDNWKVLIEDNGDNRSSCYLRNINTNEEFQLYHYYYMAKHKATIFNVNGNDYLVVKASGSGSADMFFFSVYKLEDNTVKDLHEDTIWGCFDPKLNGNKLEFYGEEGLDLDCSDIEYLRLRPRYLMSVELE